MKTHFDYFLVSRGLKNITELTLYAGHCILQSSCLLSLCTIPCRYGYNSRNPEHTRWYLYIFYFSFSYILFSLSCSYIFIYFYLLLPFFKKSYNSKRSENRYATPNRLCIPEARVMNRVNCSPKRRL
jgi:hypothetical protein